MVASMPAFATPSGSRFRRVSRLWPIAQDPAGGLHFSDAECETRTTDVMESKVDLDAVLAALRELSVGTSSSPEAFLLDHGLRVHPTLERWTYAPTPVNSVTFASTGGDGVHFGLLQGLSTTSRDGPVVMTVPMAALDHVRDANHVVAESIREFLGLGCVRGWCELEQLAYRSEYALELHSRAVAPSEPRIAQL